MIYIWANQLTLSNMYIYAGSNRLNVTTVIDNNSTAGIGAPYKISITVGAIVVL